MLLPKIKKKLPKIPTDGWLSQHQLGFLFHILWSWLLTTQHIALQCIRVKECSKPMVKCKTGSLSDVNNYRAVTISTAVSKLFESVLSVCIKTQDYVDAYQFGFTAGCSTSLCTSVFKRTVDYYTHRDSCVFACFIDFSYWVITYMQVLLEFWHFGIVNNILRGKQFFI